MNGSSSAHAIKCVGLYMIGVMRMTSAFARRALAIGALCALASACAAPGSRTDAESSAGTPPVSKETKTAVSSAPDWTPAFRVVLRGDPLTATAFTGEAMGTVPFGNWLNGIPLKEVRYGFEFSAALEDCSGFGCVVQTIDNVRVLVVGKGIADAARLSLYDDGWHRAGAAGINDAGWLAIPMASPEGSNEVWIVKQNGRMHKRIPYSGRGAAIVRWHGNTRLFVLSGGGDAYRTDRILLETGQTISATPMEPWLYSCADGVEPMAVGLAGDVAELIGDRTWLALNRGDTPGTGLLDLTDSVRPFATEGLASPVKVRIDCLGRINVVSAKGMQIWCMRFSGDGTMEKAQQIGGGLAGDFRSVYIDLYGRFYFLVTELDEDNKTPARLRLYRLD